MATYTAKLVEVLTDGFEFKMAGTLDGYIDFVVAPRRTHQLSIGEVRSIISGLEQAIRDVEQNCLYDKDELLDKRSRR